MSKQNEYSKTYKFLAQDCLRRLLHDVRAIAFISAIQRKTVYEVILDIVKQLKELEE